MRKGKITGKITESVGFKIFLFFVLGISFLVGSFSLLTAAWLGERGGYTQSFADFRESMMEREAMRHLHYICYGDLSFPKISDMAEAFSYESDTYNVTYSIVRARDAKQVWSNADEESAHGPYAYTAACYRPTWYNGAWDRWEDELYEVTLYVNPNFPKADEFQYIHRWTESAWEYRYRLLAVGAGGVFVLLFSFILLMCGAGHRKGQEGITPGVLSNIWLDLLTVFFGGGAVLIFIAVMVFLEVPEPAAKIIGLSVFGTLEAVWCTIYLREFALRMKLGKWWRHSLIWTACGLIRRVMKWSWRALTIAVNGIPEILQVAGPLMALTLCEIIGIFRWGEAELFVCWLVEKILLIPAVLYAALAFQKLLKGGRALATGKLNHKLDTGYLVLGFKEHGEDLNRIGEGISKAVEERLRSERLKTELITNVSHDLKTPLTSIINYADLLGSAATGDEEDREEQIREYSEVVLRQSGRLKRLLEDLVDISKASTGNMEVAPTPCELGVLLTQVAGEYEARLKERRLDLHMAKPEEEVRILADGRHLWRIFDNLMNNICKYAQEGSRVYLNLECQGDQAQIIFRNMSKYELNVSAQELEERFVRGDASRHMEGSGLGLSIAKSLAELQQGTMEIVTDGDLFKVILHFSILS